MKMKILVTGGTGILGREIQRQVVNNDYYEWFFPTRKELDITDFHNCYDRVKGMHVVLHCAAYTKLDRCEQNRADAYNTNVIATGIINRAADKWDVPLIYISTDYVFDGIVGNYNEHYVPNPLSLYGKTKWAGECITLGYCRQVIRTSFCIKDWPHPKAFVDKWSSFDTVDVIASYIIHATKFHYKWSNILHVGTERKTFYDLAKKFKPDVQPVSYKTVRADIPQDTSFDLRKLETLMKG